MKATRKEILVPYNFSEDADNALKTSYNLAKFINGNIVLLYVIQQGDMISQLFQDEKVQRKIEKEARKRLDQVAEQASEESNLHITPIIKRGKIYEKILETGREFNTRFIILGKRENKNDEERDLGAKITHIVKESDIPIITIKGQKCTASNYDNILVPIDLTKRTREKLFNAIAFAQHYDATIHLVSVLIGGVKARDSRIYKKMEKIRNILEENEIKCTTKLYERQRTPIHQIVLNYSQEVNADLIMVMTHKEATRSDNYIGAVAYKIINESEIPVLSFNAEAARRDEESVFKPLIDPFNIWKNN